MTFSSKPFLWFFIGVTLLPVQQFYGQAAGEITDAGQDKAELLGAAFSAYISGDLLQAQAYLQRARQIDRDDVTIRRLLQNLSPASAVSSPAVTNENQPLPPIASTTPSSDLFQPRPTSANERARQIALNNGMSPDVIDQASTLRPHVPRSVSTPLIPPQPTTIPYSQHQPSSGNIPTITPTTPSINSTPAISTSVEPYSSPQPVNRLPSEPLTLPPSDNTLLSLPGIPPPPPIPATTSGAGAKLNFTEISGASTPSPSIPELPEIITAPEPTLYPPPLPPVPTVNEPAIQEPQQDSSSLFLPELPPLDPTLSPPPVNQSLVQDTSEPLSFSPTTTIATPATSSASPQRQIEDLIAQIGLLDAQLLQAQNDGDAIKEEELSTQVSVLRNELSRLEDDIIQQQHLHSRQDTLAESTIEEEDPLNIKVGENIELMVLEDESFNGMYEVRLGGYIIIPKVGRVQVAGMTVQEAEKSVHDVFDKIIIKKPSVIIERPNAGKSEESGGIIYLTGEFKRPGPFTIVRGRAPTIVSVFIHAGGETPNADLANVRRMRLINGKNQVETFNLAEILEGNVSSDVILRDGDILQIPTVQKTTSAQPDNSLSPVVEQLRQKLEDPVKPTTGRDNGVFVTGRVKSSGFLELDHGVKVTAYSAILSRGGFAPFANPKKVYVLRETGGGQKVHIPVDIKLVQLGLEPDVELQPKDIIHVPEKFFSF